MIGWFSRKQRIVALSSTEAEYIALADGVKEVIWIKQLLQDFEMPNPYPVVVYEDNTSAISLVNNASGKRTKHIDTRYNFIRNEVSVGNLVVKHIKTSDQPADMLTKGLNHIQLDKHRSTIIGLINT